MWRVRFLVFMLTKCVFGGWFVCEHEYYPPLPCACCGCFCAIHRRLVSTLLRVECFYLEKMSNVGNPKERRIRGKSLMRGGEARHVQSVPSGRKDLSRAHSGCCCRFLFLIGCFQPSRTPFFVFFIFLVVRTSRPFCNRCGRPLVLGIKGTAEREPMGRRGTVRADGVLVLDVATRKR